MLEIEHLSVHYGSKTALSDLSTAVHPGDWLMILGPNGAGKSTILNAISGSAPYTGTIRFAGRDISLMKPRERARHWGILTQHHPVDYEFTVEEIVKLGRYAYTDGIFRKKDSDSTSSVEQALRITGLSDLREQPATTLSGGELQRTFLAQLLAQDPQLLILDEPTNHLDLGYQKGVLELVQQWKQTSGRAVISVMHDLSLARRFGTHAVLLHKGSCAAQGKINEVLSSEQLNAVYDMDVYQWMRESYRQWEDAP